MHTASSRPPLGGDRERVVPNHHAGQGSFGGLVGLAVGLMMAFGRTGYSRWAIDLTGAGPRDRVIDIGCGAGAAVRQAASAGLPVTGVDPSPEMLRLARRLSGRGQATYLEGAAEALPLADGAATAAWSIASVHHWSDLDAGLCEVRRVLAPGGRFAAIERLTRAGVRGVASQVGPSPGPPSSPGCAATTASSMLVSSSRGSVGGAG